VNEKAQQVYDFIRGYIERYGYAPTHREIMAECHLGANKVVYYLSILVAQRLIQHTPHTLRGIKLKQGEE
jgi:SOS-response transcriptional repressor LexA